MNTRLEPMQVCLIPDEYSHDPATAFGPIASPPPCAITA